MFVVVVAACFSCCIFCCNILTAVAIVCLALGVCFVGFCVYDLLLTVKHFGVYLLDISLHARQGIGFSLTLPQHALDG